jgi:exodeoxyribonuclease VII small subunit
VTAPETGPVPAEELGYAGAQDELETILSRLEDDDVDIDLLARDVERAAELIRFCRGRILAARGDVERVVADLAAAAADES